MAEGHGERHSKRTASGLQPGPEGFRHAHGCTHANLVWQVRHLVTVKRLPERLEALQNWYRKGGVMIMGYDMYRILSVAPKTTQEVWRRELKTVLVDPGEIRREWHHILEAGGVSTCAPFSFQVRTLWCVTRATSCATASPAFLKR